MRNTIRAGFGAFWMTVALPAGAVELQVQVAGQAVPDPAFGLVSESSSISTLGLQVAGPLKPGLHLSWIAGYEYGARSRYDNGGSYDYEYPDEAYADSAYGEVTTRLGLHGLEAGVRWEAPGRTWLRPYVALAGRAYLGRLTVADSQTGWSQPDPDDPTGEATLYELTPSHDTGVSAGVQGSVGVAILVPARPARKGRHASRPAGAPQAPAAAVSDPGVGAASTAGAAGTPVAAAPVTVASAAGTTEPSGAGGAAAGAPVAEADGRGETGRRAEGARERGLRWGMSFELGYSLLTALHFSEAGSLDMGGVRVQGGVMLLF